MKSAGKSVVTAGKSVVTYVDKAIDELERYEMYDYEGNYGGGIQEERKHVGGEVEIREYVATGVRTRTVRDMWGNPKTVTESYDEYKVTLPNGRKFIERVSKEDDWSFLGS